MKRKLFSLLVLLVTAVTGAWADVAPTYDLSVGTNDHGTVKFYVGTNLTNAVNAAAEGDKVTVIITPETGWAVNQPTGEWGAAVAASRSISLEKGITLNFVSEDATTRAKTYTFDMIRANAEIGCTYKKLLTNTDITIEDIADLTYNGLEQTPTVTVKDGQTVLTLGTDYTVSYSNNKNAGLSTAENAPTVTITAVATSQKYAGSTTKTFTIKKKALTVTADNKSVTFGDNAPSYSASYSGFVNGETASVLGGTLGFSCEYVKNVTVAGTYSITPYGLTSGNYAITFANGTLTVGKKALTSSMIAPIDDFIYDGTAKEPAPVVTFNGMTLEKDVDYTVSYENNVNAGTATVTITAVSTSLKYSGSATKNFNIKKATSYIRFNPWGYQKTFGDPDFTVKPETTGAPKGWLRYWSMDEDVATVDEWSGLVHITGAGVVKIYATLTGDPNYLEATDFYELTVVERVTKDGTVTIMEGGEGNTTVIIDETLDPTGSTVPEDLVANTLNYTRKLTKAGEATTTCLPYDPPTENLTYYTLDGVGEGTLYFKEIEGTPKANTPYLVVASAAADLGQLNVKDVTMVKTVANKVSVDGYVLKGTFSGIKHDDAVGLYHLPSGNLWTKVTAADKDAYIPPFRAYLETTKTGTPASLTITFGGQTGLQNIRTIDLDGTERWYDLNGHRIEKPVTKGVYVVNGRKVVIK